MYSSYGSGFLGRARPGVNSQSRVPNPSPPAAATEIRHRNSQGTKPPPPVTDSKGFAPFIHEIPVSIWEKGVPGVLGAHLMASGTVAPISTSKGAGLDVAKHVFTYPDGDFEGEVSVYASSKVAGEGVASMVLETAQKAIATKGSFTLVLSGGSLVNALGGLEGQNAEWEKWHVFWVDERVVPHSDPDSNFKGAKEAFLQSVPIPEANIHAITEGLNAQEAAKNYEGMLLGLGPEILPKLDSGFPVFDTVLLGVGPDGHVASLFPNRAQTAATEGWVLHIDNSPKPPPSRITLSLPVINSAANVAIVALGEGKAEIVQRCLEHHALPGALPAQLVRPSEGKLTWMLDAGSSKDLNISAGGGHATPLSMAPSLSLSLLRPLLPPPVHKPKLRQGWTVKQSFTPCLLPRKRTTGGATTFAQTPQQNGGQLVETNRFKDLTVLVAGATGGTGLQVVEQLVQGGARQVVAFVRDEEYAKEKLPKVVKTVQGDLYQYDTIPDALDGCMAVICASGAKNFVLKPLAPYSADYVGVENLVKASVKAGVKKFVHVSSIGVDDSNLLIALAFWGVLLMKKKGEEALQRSGLDYTIVRPGGLLNKEKEGARNVVMGGPGTYGFPPGKKSGSILRSQVAECCIEALFEPAASNKVVEIVAEETAEKLPYSRLFASS